MTDASHSTATIQGLGRLKLRVCAPHGDERLVDVSSTVCSIGSAEACTLRLRAPGIQEEHCVIHRHAEESVVYCLSEGTQLNDAEFTESPLCVGDRLRVGPLEIEVVADERATVPVAPERTNEQPTENQESTEKQLAELIAQRQTAPLDAAMQQMAQGLSQWQAEAEASLEQLSAHRGEVDRRLSQLEDQARHMTEELGKQCEQQAAPRSEAEPAWQNPLAEMQSRLDQLGQSLAAARDELEATRGEASTTAVEENQQMAERLEALEHRLKEALDQLTGQQQELAAKQEAAEAWFARVEQAENTLADLCSRPPAELVEPQREEQSARLDGLTTSLDELGDRVQVMGNTLAESLANCVTRAELEEIVASLASRAAAVQADPSTATDVAPLDNLVEEEELAFEEVSEEAPLSAAEVCRRMGAPIEGEKPPAAEAPSTPAPPPEPPADQTPDAADDEGSFVQDYMSGLFQRLRSGPSTSAESYSPHSAVATGQDEPADSFTALPEPDETIPEEEFVPRAKVPEQCKDLTALRDLANTSARKAIDTHERRHQARITRSKLIVAAIALVFCFVLTWWSTTGSTLATWASLVALIVSIYWAARYLILIRPKRSEEEDLIIRTDEAPAEEEESATVESDEATEAQIR